MTEQARTAGLRGREGAPTVVLKFGSSLLACPNDYARVAEAITGEVARGCRVLAVVSAMAGTTDSLLSAARSVGHTRRPARSASALPPDRLMGALLATGEEASVALLVLALAARGLPARGFRPWEAPVRTRGPLHDADPVGVDAHAIRAALTEHGVVVMPGFVGVDESGTPSVLGRGGSDLTALFLGDALDADEIRLVKDVDGVYPADPRLHPGLRPLTDLSWSQARAVGGCVVQPKAVAYAEQRGMSFRIEGVQGRGTRVG